MNELELLRTLVEMLTAERELTSSVERKAALLRYLKWPSRPTHDSFEDHWVHAMMEQHLFRDAVGADLADSLHQVLVDAELKALMDGDL